MLDETEKEELPKVYDPTASQRWYEYWEKEGLFHAEIEKNKKPFTIMIPPPNVTGSLHMGHAVNNTIQDVLIRKKRMEQEVAMWLPGTDHAGIATQNVVEKQLLSEGKTRHDLGREKFIERVWQWKEEYGSTIINQLKTLGCSCDWQRERFTMDEAYTKAVKKVFVELYNEGLIYRSNRIINWCPRCLTALSDIEVEHRDLEGSLWYIKYPIKSPLTPLSKRGVRGDYVIVATTRPETMLGDTAVAVNPEDKRYKHLIGKTVVLPLTGREIPVIADEFVDPKFGTGAVKVTPAHDPNDFDIGQRHNLPKINIFASDAKINENAPAYEGLDRFKAREKVVEDLGKQGLLEKTEKHIHAVGHCYRCHNVVEPYLSLQWFVDMKTLAEPAIKAVREGKIKFHPLRWTALYYHWMENIKDWCISRQIWWGHQIPAWYCQGEGCGEVVVALEPPEKCPKCGSSELLQDNDVLDTWFSSALWPFATLGWPEKTPDLEYFYPTSVLVTARDILYFWVARMIMTGLKFMNDIPFHSVVINPTVLNWEGRRMSKSLGTGLDPLDYISIYGADALRFGLMFQVTDIQDMRFTEDKLEMSRNFANKIWNASRLVLSTGEGMPAKPEELSVSSKWILSLLGKTVKEVSDSIDAYQFGEACQRLYNFFWGDFCDWYLEISKFEIGVQEEQVRWALLKVLETSLKLLHPFMPYITEDIWQRLPESKGSICISEWPDEEDLKLNAKAEQQFQVLIDFVTNLRRLRSEFMVPVSAELKCNVHSSDGLILKVLDEFKDVIFNLSKVRIDEKGPGAGRPEKSAVHSTHIYDIYLPVSEAIDIDGLTGKLDSRVKVLDQVIGAASKKLENKNFLEKAKPEIVEKEKEKLGKSAEEKQRIEAQLRYLS